MRTEEEIYDMINYHKESIIKLQQNIRENTEGIIDIACEGIEIGLSSDINRWANKITEHKLIIAWLDWLK